MKSLTGSLGHFSRRIVTPAIRRLPPSSRTRKNNLALDFTPSCFRIYPEDLTRFSRNIDLAFRSLPHDFPFRYHFLYVKYGQQLSIPDLRTLDLGLVTRPRKLALSSVHVAVNYTHQDSHFSIFWDRPQTTTFLFGSDVVKYPFMGLNELGNITSKRPRRLANFLQDVHVPFVQAYTPFVKPFDEVSQLMS